MLKKFFLNVKKTKAKKAFITITIIAAIIIPTLSALGYVFYAEFIDRANYFTVSIYDMEDKLLHTEEEQPSGADNDSLTAIFYEITTLTATPLTNTPTTEGLPYIRAVTDYDGIKHDIKCYFSKNGSAFFINKQEQAFSISKKTNDRFLKNKYSEYFYENSKAYNLTTLDLDTVLPKTLNWKYKNIDNEFINASLSNKSAQNKLTYEITGALDIKFDTKPDFSLVKVYDGDKLIYNGTLERLSTLTVASDKLLNVTVEAEWYKSKEQDKYGSIYYDFAVKIKNPSEFSLNVDTIHAGEFAILSGTNISDISKLVFTSEGKELTPNFIKANNTVKALLYFPESEIKKEYSFSVSYGAAKQSFTLSILPTEYKGEYNLPDLSFTTADTPSLINDKIRQELIAVKLKKNDNIYFRGNFSSPIKDGYTELYSHNSTVKWGQALENSYIALGNRYVTDIEGGASVRTIESGVVAYIGESNSLGKYIIIDHGCGISSVYAQLSHIDAELGDILLKDEILGKAGSLPDKSNGFELYCMAYDILIAPNILWAEEA